MIYMQVSWVRTLSLAFQSVGIIYGDIGTSPLYVYSSTFPDGSKDRDDLLGVRSLILYTLIIIPMLKYAVCEDQDDTGPAGRGCCGVELPDRSAQLAAEEGAVGQAEARV